MTFDLETLNIFIYAFFAIAAASVLLSARGVAMVLSRPATPRPALASVTGIVREQLATTGSAHAA